MKANCEETLSRTFVRHEVIGENTSCLMSDDLDTLKAYLERLHEKALAKAVAYPPLPDSYASKMGAAN